VRSIFYVFLRILLSGVWALISMLGHGAAIVHSGAQLDDEINSLTLLFLCALFLPGLYAIWTRGKVPTLRKVMAVLAASLAGAFWFGMKVAVGFAATRYDVPWEMAARAVFGFAALIAPMIVAYMVLRRRHAEPIEIRNETA
jgi:hypothetical protein